MPNLDELKAIDTKEQMIKVINKEKVADIRVFHETLDGYMHTGFILTTGAGREIWFTDSLQLGVVERDPEVMDFGTGNGVVIEGDFDWRRDPV